MGWLWLIGTVVAVAAACYLGWPAWTGYRSREARDLNTERYLAWRGRADRTGGTMREGMTVDERRRFLIAGALVIVALFCLVAFFAYA